MDGKLVYGRPGDEYYFDPYEEVWPLYNWSFVSDKQGGLLVKGRANELFTRPGKSVQMKVLSLSIEKERFVVKGKDRIYGLDYKTHDVVTRDLDNILPTLRVLLKNSPEAFTYIKELLPKIKKYTHNRELNRRKEICRMIPAESENAILFSFVGGEYVYADGIFIKTGNEYRYVSFKYDKCSKADPLYLKDKKLGIEIQYWACMGKLDSFEKMYMHEGTLDFENGKKRKIFIDKWEVPSEYDIYFYNNENWDVEARLIRNHFILPAEGLLQYNRT